VSLGLVLSAAGSRRFRSPRDGFARRDVNCTSIAGTFRESDIVARTKSKKNIARTVNKCEPR
jgi:hypothetical protein